MNDDVFWKCTLRKLLLVWEQYKIHNGIKDKNEVGYIDEIDF